MMTLSMQPMVSTIRQDEYQSTRLRRTAAVMIRTKTASSWAISRLNKLSGLFSFIILLSSYYQMDSFTFDVRLLFNCDSSVLLELSQFIKLNKPSQALLADILSYNIHKEELLALRLQLPQLLTFLGQKQVSSLLFKGVLGMFKCKDIDLKELSAFFQEGWPLIHPGALPYYDQYFRFRQSVNQQIILKAVLSRLRKQGTSDIVSLLKFFKIDQDSTVIRTLVDVLNQEKQSAKAASVIRQMGFNIGKFPQIKDRLDKKSLRFFIAEVGWSTCQQLYKDNKKILGFLAQDLIYRNMCQEALYLEKKYELLQNGCIQKKEAIQFLTANRNSQSKTFQKVLDNFSPMDPSALSLLDLGITRSDVIFIETKEDLQRLRESLKRSRILSFDTQTRPGNNSLDKPKHAALVQIANQEGEVFLLDLLKKELVDQVSRDLQEFLQSRQRIKVGHTIRQDLKSLYTFFKKPSIVRSLQELSPHHRCLRHTQKTHQGQKKLAQIPDRGLPQKDS